MRAKSCCSRQDTFTTYCEISIWVPRIAGARVDDRAHILFQDAQSVWRKLFGLADLLNFAEYSGRSSFSEALFRGTPTTIACPLYYARLSRSKETHATGALTRGEVVERIGARKWRE